MLLFYLSLLDTPEQKDKFEMLYNDYSGLMYYEAKKIIIDHHLAEDVVHDTFIHLIKIIDKIRVENKRELFQFVKLLTQHRAVDYIRKTKKEFAKETIENEDVLNELSDPETVVISNELCSTLVEEFQALNCIYKVPLVLKIQGYKISEIANLLEITEENVKVRIHRARKILISTMEAYNAGK